MTASITHDETNFRAEVTTFCRSWVPVADPFQSFKDRSGITVEVYRALGERDWLALGWPSETGGRGLPPVFEFILWDELAYHRLARPSLAAGIVAKSLLAAGSEQQRDEYLPRIRRGEFSFALGYSEPEAGSDLVALRCRARQDGDNYVITGEKRWTSDAHHSDALWLLARTGTAADGARGLTLFIVDLATPGISVSPIPTLDGHQLNAVYLDDVVVSADRRVGGQGEAWPIVQKALAEERHLQVLPGRLRRDFEDLVAWAIDTGRASDSAVRGQLADIVADIDLVEAGCRELVRATSQRGDTSVAAARQKLIGTELMQRMARLPSECGDPGAVVAGSPFSLLWRQSILETIAGGTTQIMRDMIARRTLDLGRSTNRRASA